MKRNPWLTLIGFILFTLGLLSLILKIVGMQFIFLSFIQDIFGNGSFIVFLVIMLMGFIIFYLSSSPTYKS